ncbi:MAG: TetR/AcrR family transcriptional regulator [Lactobacillus sp.]|jgi:AcrR family transcriptional regulator|nr:TetR/AcrR family transcriptional regulator [Lactobacillus sp.]
MIDKKELAIALNHVILIKGFKNISMTQLAKSVGISRASLYLRFKDKADIVTAVVDRHLQFVQSNPIPKEPTLASLGKVLLDYALLVGSTTDIFLNDLQSDFPQLATQLAHTLTVYFTHVATYLTQAQHLGYLKPDFDSKFILFEIKMGIDTILKAVLSQALTTPQAEDYLRQFFQLQLAGLLTEKAQKKVTLKQLQSYENKILAEFEQTYAQVTQ